MCVCTSFIHVCSPSFPLLLLPLAPQLVQRWKEQCGQLHIPISDDLTVTNTLADSYEIRQWNQDGLPRDSVSTENAVLVTRGRRWPDRKSVV